MAIHTNMATRTETMLRAEPKNMRTAPRQPVTWGVAKIASGLVVLAGAAVVTWISLGLTAGLTPSVPLGSPILGYSAFVAEANARKAARHLEQYIVKAEPEQLVAAASLAERALAREPGNVAAARSLGLVASVRGKAEQADRFFAYTETLSRRDQPTEQWLIERNVSRGDITGALAHYDRSMRVSQSSRQVLMPVLARAADDPSIARPLAKIVAGRPNWWPDFMTALLRDGQSTSSLVTVASALKLNSGKTDDRWWLGGILDRLVDKQAYGPAFTLYRLATTDRTQAALRVRNPLLDRAGTGPFEWAITADPDLAGVYQRRPDSAQMALFLTSTGTGGTIARQLLMLPAGNYRLAGIGGDVIGEAATHPIVSLSCAKGMGQEAGLAEIVLPKLPSQGGRFSQGVVVPTQGCTAQWLTVSLKARDYPQDTIPWLSRLDVQPS